MLCAREAIGDAPFAVINADDYYGPEPFEELYRFLTTPQQQNGKYQLCMAGYRLVNTLSEKGTVARGVCTVDENGRLTDIDERMKIGWTPDGRIADMNCEPPKEYAPQTPEETWNPLFVEALQKKAHTEYLLDVLLSGSMEERASVVAQYGKEVRKIEQRISEFTASHPAGRHERSRSLSAGAER